MKEDGSSLLLVSCEEAIRCCECGNGGTKLGQCAVSSLTSWEQNKLLLKFTR